jgi:hypothetical protein
MENLDLQAKLLGVQRSKEVLQDVGNIAAIITQLVRHGMDSQAFFKLTGLVSHVLELMQDAPAAWPELKELDEAEAAALGAEAYKAAKMIYDAIKL